MMAISVCNVTISPTITTCLRRAPADADMLDMWNLEVEGFDNLQFYKSEISYRTDAYFVIL